MPRYKGTVTQSILDWYAAQAMAAQQWFTQAAPNYWAFSLLNNATDGRRIWVYDAETVSGSAFPAGTGNPGGNAGASAGYQGAGVSPVQYQLITHSNAIAFGATSLAVTAPAAIVAGNLIIVVFLSGNFAASFIQPPDATWSLITSADGNSNSPSIAAFAHIATGSEPGSWTFTCHNTPASAQGAIAAQFSGNVISVSIDSSAANISTSATLPMTAPGLFLTGPGDLLLTVYGAGDAGLPTFGGDPSFTPIDYIQIYGQILWVGFKVAPRSGGVGPFIGAQSRARYYAALSMAMKGSFPGSPPYQALAAPIASASPTLPGIFSVNFSQTPIALPGITRWIPPAAHFEWHREAPIAVIQANDQFNLASIAPENAAWGSLTWLAIK